MIRKIGFLSAVAGLLFSLVGCASIRDNVETVYNKSVDFSALETYSWWSIQGLERVDFRDYDMIRDMVDQDLQSKGLRLASDNPDFLVVVLLKKQHQVDNEFMHQPSRETRTGWWNDVTAPVYWGGPVAWNYEEGTMVIDFVRPKTNHMAWRGTASSNLRKVDTPEKRAELIQRSVRRILAKFPPS